MKHLEIVCIDDHPVFLKGFADILQQMPNVREVYDFSSGLLAVEHVAKSSPHIIFTDLKLKDSDGFELCRQFKQLCPSSYLAVLTTYDEHIAPTAFANGADAYFSKEGDIADIEKFVLSFNEFKQTRQAVYAARSAAQAYDTANALIEKLTPREKELMHLEAKGYKRAEILGALAISEHTYKSHITNIKAKLNLNNISSIISFASRHFPIK